MPVRAPLDTPLARRLGWLGLSIDLAMLGLAVVNLAWLLYDSLWAIPELRELMAWIVPSPWLAAYAPIHEHFFRIDLIFVSVFLAEFMLRWGEAIWHRRHSHWFAYPVLHWYDILGCVPVAELRWLRVLRVFAILIRLQHLGVIDYRHWAVYRAVKAVYDVILEEISDRVVIRVLSGAQQEIAASGPLEQKILTQVIRPRQAEITQALRQRLVPIVQRSYRDTRGEVNAFVTASVSRAVHANREIKVIDRIPVVGGVAGQLLDHAITDIVCRVIADLADQLSAQEFATLFDEICEAVIAALIDSSGSQSDQLSAAINEIIDLVKAQVAEKRWLEPANPDLRA